MKFFWRISRFLRNNFGFTSRKDIFKLYRVLLFSASFIAPLLIFVFPNDTDFRLLSLDVIFCFVFPITLVLSFYSGFFRNNLKDIFTGIIICAFFYGLTLLVINDFRIGDFIILLLLLFGIPVGLQNLLYTIGLFSVSIFTTILFYFISAEHEISFSYLLSGQVITLFISFVSHYTKSVLMTEVESVSRDIKDSRDRLLTVINSIDSIFYSVSIDDDQNKHLRFVSNKVEDLYGIPSDEFFSIVKSGRLLERIHPDDRKAVLEMVELYKNVIKPISYTFRFKPFNSEKYIWIEEKVFPKLDDNGKHIANIGLASDVTLRIESENNKRKTEEKFKGIIYRNLAGYYRIDMSYVLNECNDSFASIFGFLKREDILGKNVQDIYSSSTDQEDFIQRVLITGNLKNHESKINLRNGSVIWLMENVSCIEEDGEKFIEGTVFDITFLKNAQERVLRSESNLSMVINNIDSLVYSMSFNESGSRDFDFLGDQIVKLTGLEKAEYIALVKSGRIISKFHPDDLPQIHKSLDRIKSKRENGFFQYRFYSNKIDEYIWLEEHIFPVFNNEGRLIRNFGIVQDITERKKFQETLQESEKKYRTLFEKNMAGVFSTTLTGQLLECNESFIRIFGYESKDEILKINSREFYFSDEERNKYISDLRSSGFLSNYELRAKRKDGSEIWISANVSFNEGADLSEPILFGTLIDISEVKRFGEIIQSSEEKFRSLFDLSGDAIVLLSGQTIIDCNESMQNLVDFSKRNIIGSMITDFSPSLQRQNISSSSLWSEKLELCNSGEHPFFLWKVLTKSGDLLQTEVSMSQIILKDEIIIQCIIRDVTQRIKAEEERLRAQIAEQTNVQLKKEIEERERTQLQLLSIQKFTSSIIESSIDMIIATDNNENITEMNFSALQTFGYSRDEIVNLNPADLYFSAEEYERVKKSLDTSGYYCGEVRNMRKNGEGFTSFISASLIIDPSGERIGSMGISRDISEVIEAERIMRDQHAKIQSIFENSSNLLIWTIDKEFKITSYNQNFKRLLKDSFDIDLEIGIDFMDSLKRLIREDIFDKTRQKYISAFEGNPQELEGPLNSINDQRLWFETFLNPIFNSSGIIDEISCVSHDITEKKQVQYQLLKSEERNIAMINALPDLILRMDGQGVFLDVVYKRREDLLDDPDNFLGRKITEQFQGELGEKFLFNISTCLREGNVIQYEYEITIRNNYTGYFEARYSRINENEVLVVIRDITEKKAAEIELLSSLKEKEVLLKEVHHRVKNNLQVISSILNLQSTYVKEPSTLQILKESQNRIKSMSFIHESLYQTKNFSSINFSEYIMNLSKNLVHSYQLFDEFIDVQYELQQVELNLDQAIPCGLIVNELVSNALKYAFKDAEKAILRIAVEEMERTVILRVSDNGIGLPVGFDVNTTQTLGLQLVVTLVEQIDGTLEVHSESGVGTGYLITFVKQRTD